MDYFCYTKEVQSRFRIVRIIELFDVCSYGTHLVFLFFQLGKYRISLERSHIERIEPIEFCHLSNCFTWI